MEESSDNYRNTLTRVFSQIYFQAVNAWYIFYVCKYREDGYITLLPFSLYNKISEE